MSEVYESMRQKCPQCGTARIGSFRYCRSCQFDFEEALSRPPTRHPLSGMFVPFDLFDPPREARPTISPAILVGALALVAIVVGLVAFVAVRILG